ncbi:MAG: hypothetical protein II889_01260 [Clostridia bacterium]|nr:hypothetical protein [Clostridia bacterium]
MFGTVLASAVVRAECINCVEHSNLNFSEISSLCFSSIAILISVITLIEQKRRQRTELEYEFFKNHFMDYLNNDIPNGRKLIVFEDEKLVGIDNLLDVLTRMRKDADYFKYSNNKFYKKFKKVNQKLEDFLSEGLNKQGYDNDRQSEFNRKCDRKIRKLYITITKQYFGL